jgi:hypothetical protein
MGELVRTPTFHDLASELNVPRETDMELALDSSELMAKCSGKYDGVGVNDARNDARNVDRPFTGSGG